MVTMIFVQNSAMGFRASRQLAVLVVCETGCEAVGGEAPVSFYVINVIIQETPVQDNMMDNTSDCFARELLLI